jgi:hypothetical protein
MEETCGGHVINGPENSWLSLYVLSSTRSVTTRGVVAERLCDKSERGPAEGVPDELFNIRFRKTELHYRNLAAALAQLLNVGLSRNGRARGSSGYRSRRGGSSWTASMPANRSALCFAT